MLINLSNHPSAKWLDKQKMMALDSYTYIFDFPFPDVGSQLSEYEIKLLADEISEKCLQLIHKSPHAHNAVHIMGELTLCFAIIKNLQQHEIECIASTTERITTINGNEKKSTFQFQRFRKYL
jgi:hypothetical protein